MSKPGVASNIKLHSIDSLFGNTDTSKDIDSSKEQIIEVPINELHAFKNHPFRVIDDDKMKETVESVREHGVIVPGIVRKRASGGYEIISGHRRRRACEILGLETMPVFVRNLTDDEATVVMVDSNIQREELLPSEKAKAYKMRYEALKHQGKAVEQKGRSVNAMGENTGESASTVQRYIKIADLNEEFLKLIDEKKMGLSQGVDLSYLTAEEQEMVSEVISEVSKIPSMLQTSEMKELSKSEGLDPVKIKSILIGAPKPQKRSFSLKDKQISKYFPDTYTNEQINDVIFSLLDKWKSEQK